MINVITIVNSYRFFKSKSTVVSLKLKAPQRKNRRLAWVELRKEDLLADWKLAQNGELPFKIEPIR